MTWVARQNYAKGNSRKFSSAVQLAIETIGRWRVMALVLGLSTSFVGAAQTEQEPKYRLGKLVSVEGQPEPVPAEWVSTPEGAFAHSLKVPNPVPKYSGYLRGMNSEEYFDRLCKREAGEFIAATAEGVEGFLFMRPPRRPTDSDLLDRYKLEAPGIQRTFQLIKPSPQERAKIFVNPPWRLYTFVEEPSLFEGGTSGFVRALGYRQREAPMKIERMDRTNSRYGLTWRGIRRIGDRELAIAGSEWIVVELEKGAVMAVYRDYARTGETPNTPEGIWWLNARGCPGLGPRSIRSKTIYDFVSRVIRP